MLKAAAVPFVVAGLALTACGSSAAPAPTILDTEKVERAVEGSSLAQRRVRVDVSCPSGVHQKKGVVFACSAVNSKGVTRFTVSQLDDRGRVHYEAK